MEEIELQAGPHRPVHRVGDTVRRRPGWWTGAVHDLLRYLNDSGFDLAPTPLGTDEQGREVLSYIDGESGRSTWRLVVGDDGLAAFAATLRRFHDAVAGYRPPAGTEWAYGQLPLGDGELICHGDFGPWNLVWRDGVPVGIVDWDLAYPGPALDDVAYALVYGTPFRDDDHAVRSQAYPEPPDRRHRIGVFAEAYGIRTDGLVDAVVARQRKTTEHTRILKARGLIAPWTTTASIAQDDLLADWSDTHRHLF
ncbi:MAG: aminoglycoside phosphotransferase family protein [Acidimicrobiales bacterium]